MLRFLLLLTFSFLLCGCSLFQSSEMEKAKNMIRENKAQCVLLRDGKIIYAECGGGVSPLLRIYETHRDQMKGSVIVDKVIGRAAGSIAICGKVRHVHGEVMSEDAAAFLKENHITVSCTLLVPRILNQKRDGLCPLERSVLGEENPEKALAALKKKIAEFQEKTVR